MHERGKPDRGKYGLNNNNLRQSWDKVLLLKQALLRSFSSPFDSSLFIGIDLPPGQLFLSRGISR